MHKEKMACQSRINDLKDQLRKLRFQEFQAKRREDGAEEASFIQQEMERISEEIAQFENQISQLGPK